MANNKFLNGIVAASAITVLSVGAASAAGTAAGTSVSNTFTLDYSVGGVDQPTIDTGAGPTPTPTLFTVDRLVDLTVVSTGNTTVAPGAQDEELTFTLTNTGNDTQGYTFTLFNEDEAGAPATEFDATGLEITYYVGTSATGTAMTYTPGSGLSTIDVPADGQIFVVVSGDIPTTGGAPTMSDGDVADITLVANTVEPGAAGTATAEVTADVDGNNAITGAAENVLADGTGTARDLANQGDHSATATYIVASADLAASKTVGIISEDGSGCAAAITFPRPAFTTTEYSVPGACIEYRITAQNTGSGAAADATDLEIVDVLPADLSFVQAAQNGFTGGIFNTPGSGQDCTGGACTVELTSVGAGTPAGLANSSTGVIVIRALLK